MTDPSEIKESSHLLGSYGLLKKYLNESNTLSSAFHYSSKFHRSMYKWLTYPLIITSTVATLLAGLEVNNFIVAGVSFTSLILVGFNSAINPKKKEIEAHDVSIEFSEIASDIELFIIKNGKTKVEIEAYASHINDLLNVWKAQSPAVNGKYIKKARLACIERKRRSNSSSKKNDNYGTSIECRV
jgi:hypothetical protein